MQGVAKAVPSAQGVQRTRRLAGLRGFMPAGERARRVAADKKGPDNFYLAQLIKRMNSRV